MCIFYIITEYHTPTIFVMASAIKLISTATIRLATYVPSGVHWPQIQIFSTVHYNRIAQ